MIQEEITKVGMETLLSGFDKVMSYLYDKACFMAEKQGYKVYGKAAVRVNYSEHPGWLSVRVLDKHSITTVSFNLRPAWMFLNNELFAKKIEQVEQLDKLSKEYSGLAQELEGAAIDIDSFTKLAKEAEETLRTAPARLKELDELIDKAQKEMLDE